MDLRNSVGILTGASRGIGVYLAEALAREGVHLALAARSAEDLEVTAKRLEGFGIRTTTVRTDVTNPSDLENLVDRATNDLGPVDILVNNAGVEQYQPYQEYEFDMIEKIMKTNVIAAQWLTRMVLPGMVERHRGHIVNIASMAGKMAVPYNAVYSASKHALVGFSWSLHEEMLKHNVGVSAICPGFVADAGMFADWSQGKRPPGVAGTVEPETVAVKTIEAIKKNKAEVMVAPPVMKISKAAPYELVAAIARRTGGYDFLEKVAVKAWRDK